MTPAVEERLQPILRLARLVWLALTIAVPIYGLVAVLATNGEPPQPGGPLQLVFVAASVFCVVALWLFPRFYPTRAMVKEIFTRELSPEGLAAALSPHRIDPTTIDSTRELSLEERQQVLAGRLFLQATIIRLSYAESIAIYGFVLSFLARTPTPMLWFGPPALVLLILCFPRLEPFMERIESLRAG